jgi:adenylyltransferase/sulfurtransferase
VLGVITGIVGSLQALEVVKLVTGAGQPLVGRLLMVDALGSRFRELALRRDPECPVCGPHPTVTALIDYEAFCAGAAGAPTSAAAEITPHELAHELPGGRIQLVDVREPWEWEIGRIAGAVLAPLDDLDQHTGQLDKAGPVVTYCHHGRRSLWARQVLLEAGFRNVRSLAGGIDAWSREIDPEQPRY